VCGSVGFNQQAEEIMKFKIQKLDGRHNGYRLFTHRVEVIGDLINYRLDRLENFLKLRSWCLESFGEGCERDIYEDFYYRQKTKHNEFWAWHFTGTHDAFYIYLTEKGYTQFKLKWD